jgi:tetratricopeptide (TPR) repeat protein
MRNIISVCIMLGFIFVLPAVASPEIPDGIKPVMKNYYSGKYKEVVRDLKEYTEKTPDPAAYYLIGYSLYKLRNYAESEEYFKKAFLLDPQFSPETVGLVKRSPAREEVAAQE